MENIHDYENIEHHRITKHAITHIQERNQLSIFLTYIPLKLFASYRKTREQLLNCHSCSNLSRNFLFRHKNTRMIKRQMRRNRFIHRSGFNCQIPQSTKRT